MDDPDNHKHTRNFFLTTPRCASVLPVQVGYPNLHVTGPSLTEAARKLVETHKPRKLELGQTHRSNLVQSWQSQTQMRPPCQTQPAAGSRHRNTKHRSFRHMCVPPNSWTLSCMDKARPPTHAPAPARCAAPPTARAHACARPPPRERAHMCARGPSRQQPDGWRPRCARGMSHRSRCWAHA